MRAQKTSDRFPNSGIKWKCRYCNNTKLPLHKQRKETEGVTVKSQIPHEIGQYNSDIISFWIPGTIIASQK